MKLDKTQVKQIEYAYSYTNEPLDAFKADARAYIKALEQKRVLFDVVHVSKSGMQRVISIRSCERNPHQRGEWYYRGYYKFFKALGWGYDMQKAGVKIKGAGMNMRFALNYSVVVELRNMGLIKSAKASKLQQTIS